MKPSPETPESSDAIAQAAAEWALRRDRGLSAAEQDDYLQWLARDPRHGAAVAEHSWAWDELDRLTGLQTSLKAVPDPDLFAPRRSPVRWWWAGATLATCAAALAFVFLRPIPTTPLASASTAATAASAPCERRTLDDGSVVDLNRQSTLEVNFSAEERRVQLVQGEANFIVAKDPTRPFIVRVGHLEVRAVGTIFNVQLQPGSVEVLVSEGRVQLSSLAPAGAVERPVTSLSVGQRAVVPLAAPAVAPSVTTLTPAQVAARLAWQPTLLDFTDAPLAAIVDEFNRRNPVQIVIGDPSLEGLRLSASFRSDNVEGFVRLMESDFSMKADVRSDREIVLRPRR